MSDRKSGDEDNHDQKNVAAKGKDATSTVEPPKLGLFARFKLLWKQYWYIVLPVHVVTSISWFGSFYYLAASGFDVIGYLETASFMPESAVALLHKIPSTAGNAAVAYALYKVFTPIRYAVTVGITTLTIRFLSVYGFVPTTSQVQKRGKQMYEDGKERWSERRASLRQYVMDRRRAGTRFHARQRLNEKQNGTGGDKSSKRPFCTLADTAVDYKKVAGLSGRRTCSAP